LFSGVWEAGPYGLSFFLMEFGVLGLALGIFKAFDDRDPLLVLGLIGAGLILALLSLIAEYVMVVIGAVDRRRQREAEWRAELASWPPWKRRAFILVVILVVVVVMALRTWSHSL
jgi:uncharacterized membrane protein